MIKYTLKRIIMLVPVLIGISLLTYALITMLPGSPVDYMANSNFSTEDYYALLEEHGFNAPWYQQYWVWLKGLLGGDWGVSYQTHQPVLTMINERLPATLLLMGTAIILTILISIPLGVICAVKQNGPLDYSLSSLSFLGASFPTFFMAMAMIYVVCVKAGLLPSSGMYSGVNTHTVGDLIKHLILPASTVAIGSIGTLVRYVRAAVLEELGMDYLRTAKAKGVKPLGRIMVHAFRNSLLSIITLVSMQIPSLFGGSVIVEKIFSWPGIGSLMSTSITARDYPVLMAMILIFALVVVTVNLVTDLIYALVDPRIRLK